MPPCLHVVYLLMPQPAQPFLQSGVTSMRFAFSASLIRKVLLIPEGKTHFAIGFYSTAIADLRNTTTKVIPLLRTFPATA